MKAYFSFLLFLFLFTHTFGQRKTNNNLKVNRLEGVVISTDCVKFYNKSFSKRINNFPFNKAVKIEFVSFKPILDSLNKIIINDRLPIQNDTVCLSNLFERKSLTILQIDSLTNILYNYAFPTKAHELTEGACYNPRNAILFFDSDNKVFEYIEICFECTIIHESSKKIVLEPFCPLKYNMLKDLFKTVGIKYGILMK